MSAAGFFVVAADLFAGDAEYARLEKADIAAAVQLSRSPQPDAELAALSPGRRRRIQRADKWRARVAASADDYLPRVSGLLRDLTSHPGVLPGSVGAVGFSMGGRLVWRLATESRGLRAGVVYYGRVPPPTAPISATAGMLGHYAASDSPVTDAIAGFAERYREAGGRFDYYVYPGTEHGFFNETRPEYAEEAARLSWERTMGYLAAELVMASRGS